MLTKVPVSEPTIGDLERAALIASFETGWISSLGPNLNKTANDLSAKLGISNVSLVSSGTTALHLALLALGIKSGDEVIVPDLSYVAVPNAVIYCGARPVFVDVEDATLGYNLVALEAAITPATKAIIAVHNYGFVGDMLALKKIAISHSIPLIEDCAEAPFHMTPNGLTGSFGDIATYSFFGNKIATSGEGGAVASSNEAIIRRVDFLKNQGAIPGRRFEFEEVGYNYRMTNLQAAILEVQLNRVSEFIAARKTIFTKYDSEFSHYGIFEHLGSTDASPWMYSLRFTQTQSRDERKSLMGHLEDRGIESRPYFQPHSLSGRFGLNPEKFPVSNNVYLRSINLPTFSHMSEFQIYKVTDAVKEWVTAK